MKTDGTDPSSGCSGGDSWDNAFATIEKAVECASDGDEIWVKFGTYSVSQEINLNKNIALYGGFSGTETSRDQRDWQANETTIDGNNSVRCINITGTTDTTVDGFTIENGKANSGGGVFISGAHAVIANCTISDCLANLYRGGGIFITDSSVVLHDCIISSNSAYLSGGGIYMGQNQSTIQVVRCTITGNHATNGAGISIYSSSPIIKNSIVSNNSPEGSGGGGGIYIAGDSSPSFSNCDVSGNSAYYGGGVQATASSQPVFQECVFSSNTGVLGGAIYAGNGCSLLIVSSLLYENTGSGAGLYNQGDTTVTNCTFSENSGQPSGIRNISVSGVDLTVTNSILRGDEGTNNEIVNDIGASFSISYSDIDQDGFAGANHNIRQDPVFADTSSHDYRLLVSSPCVDTASSVAPELPSTDKDGNRRTLDGDNNGIPVPDMGAYEFVADTVLHKDGAIWNKATGWDIDTPPYYPDSNYARDIEFAPGGDTVILHKDGAIWRSSTGWILTTPPYYSGSDYAKALEVRTWSGAEYYVILHRDGAIYDSENGWNTNSPPYYKGANWARDIEITFVSNPSPQYYYNILHKYGAIWSSYDGWHLSTPPYYPGTDWAVDLEYWSSSRYMILHHDGALYDSQNGWILTSPPYYAGSNYAVDLELKADGANYRILHKGGAIYDSVTGWNLNTPPYYNGSVWAVDLEVR